MQPTLTIPKTVYPQGWPDPPGVEVLQNDYPAVIAVGDNTYPSVTHAYWALSTPDPHWHDQITAAPRGYDASKLAEQAPRRADWASARLAVMAALLRAKYTQHPQMAQTLLASGDAHIVYVDFSAYWSVGSERATNWIGRLLEVIFGRWSRHQQATLRGSRRGSPSECVGAGRRVGVIPRRRVGCAPPVRRSPTGRRAAPARLPGGWRAAR
ncbi:NADAR family protein [Micromonospora profundi]|uniref:NADAR family protein n=1 Tax=Micromonospora profundi TaxID=1420889 RepID=UPI00365A436B